ncbi:MAG: hypothetical protein CMH91_07505 [Oceanicaulis sp.]|uniref:tape measure protein n=1 Tax=unclassified Oceanicaulis TaxID=2632123 RepID=UPI000C3E0487|nr:MULTISPECIES: tape measure protein [unclassified Oceanicaulis]MBC38893.1 hypothetical protein [Oceanicaulis sp.]MBG35946.1 hypothetical protein [Oceanicaulis sp.]HBU63643.1 hypothetical protein [Oceanicaulis sp.]
MPLGMPSDFRFDIFARDRSGPAWRGVENSVQRTQRAAESFGRTLTGLLAGVSAALLVREFIQVADSVTQLEGRIGLYTDSVEEANSVIAALFDRSTELGASFDGLAETYARIAPAQDALNLSTQQMLDLSEAVASAFIVSGASAEEARNATLQLSQAFASGELRGEELRSVMEQGQRIMLALQNQTGLTTGELRELAEQGGLTADVVSRSLLAELSTLRSELDEMPETVGRAATALGNELAAAVSDLNDELGVTAGIARVLRYVADDLQAMRSGLSPAVGDATALAEQMERIAAAESEVARLAFRGAGVSVIDAQARRILGADRVEEIRDSIERGENFGTQYAEALQAALLAKRLEVREAILSLTEVGPVDPVRVRLGAGAGDGSKSPANRLSATATGMDDPSKTNTARELARIEAEAKAAALSEEKRTAEELGRLQAQAYKDQLGEDRGAFMDEFAAVFAGGAKAAFDGDLEEFLIERLRQASYQGLYDAFQALGGSLFDGLGGSKGGGFLGSVLGVFGFGGKRAAGGPARPGMAYQWQENGREFFTPSVPGEVIPASDMGREIIRERVVVVQVDKSPLFETAVQEAAAPVAVQAAQGAVQQSRADMAGQTARARKRLR